MPTVNAYWLHLVLVVYRIASSPVGRTVTVFSLVALVMLVADKCDDVDFRK